MRVGWRYTKRKVGTMARMFDIARVEVYNYRTGVTLATFATEAAARKRVDALNARTPDTYAYLIIARKGD